jgi:hypothetical protein
VNGVAVFTGNPLLTQRTTAFSFDIARFCKEAMSEIIEIVSVERLGKRLLDNLFLECARQRLLPWNVMIHMIEI